MTHPGDMVNVLSRLSFANVYKHPPCKRVQGNFNRGQVISLWHRSNGPRLVIHVDAAEGATSRARQEFTLLLVMHDNLLSWVYDFNVEVV